MEAHTTLNISGINMVAISILVFFIGYFFVHNVKMLRRYNIPEGIVGGVLVSLFFFFIKKSYHIKVVFDTDLRDLFLMIFFCTVGMTAKFKLLISGGRTLAKLIVVVIAFLMLQNLTGVAVARLIGESDVEGLIAGSITLAGGHGTAISWGTFFEEHGFKGATEYGLISATIGLVCGGIFGAPVAEKLIHKHKLLKFDNTGQEIIPNEDKKPTANIERLATTFIIVLMSIFFVILCIILGEIAHKFLLTKNIVTPAYLPVLLIGILFTNTSEYVKITIPPNLINLFRDVSLQVFITMSMMCVNIEYLFDKKVFSIITIIAVQIVMVVLFAKHVFFKAAGKNYDGAVITGGFIGSGLGATPVALANVDVIGRKYHQSDKALLIVPLLGSVFTDFFSAIILQGFLHYLIL
ncbi:MAG: sodium/glutamate symporter [Rickettsiales bacterium]